MIALAAERFTKNQMDRLRWGRCWPQLVVVDDELEQARWVADRSSSRCAKAGSRWKQQATLFRI